MFDKMGLRKGVYEVTCCLKIKKEFCECPVQICTVFMTMWDNQYHSFDCNVLDLWVSYIYKNAC